MELFQQLVGEITGSATGGAVGGYVVLGLYILAAILVLVGLLKGWSRGMYRSLSRLLTVVAAMVLSVYLCLQLYPTFLSMCEGQTLMTLLQSWHLDSIFAGHGFWGALLGGLSGEALALFAALPAALVVVPSVMIGVFMVSSALLLLLHALICHIFGWDPYCNNALTRVVGAVLGVVQGALVTLFLFIPVFSSISYAGMMSAEAPEQSQIHIQYETYLRAADESLMGRAVRSLGGDAMTDALEARMTVDGEPMDVEALMRSLGGMVGQVQVLEDADFKNLTDDEIHAMRQILDLAEQSDEARTLLAELMRVSAATLSEYERTLPFNEPFLSTLRDFIDYFRNELSDEYVVEDLTTLTEAYIALMDSGVLKAVDAAGATEALMREGADGKRPLTAAVELLLANERTAPLADSVMDFAVAVMAEDADVTSDVLYDRVAEGLRTAVASVNGQGLTGGEAYEAALVTEIAALFEANGMTASEAGLASMASCIATNNAGASELSDEAVRNILLAYFEA